MTTNDLARDFAMGIMLTFTKNEYKNDYTLNKIQQELINLYHKVHDSEMKSFIFCCQANKENINFYSKYDFSNYKIDNDNNDENFFRTMENLLLEIKEESLEGFEENVNRYIEETKGFVFSFLSIFIFNFFQSYGTYIQKYYVNSYLRWSSFDDRKYRNHKLTIFHILQKIDKVKKILVKNIDKEENIEINDIDNIKKKYFNLGKNGKKDTLHFIYEHKEVILYRAYDKIHYLKFTQKELHHDLLPYIFNTKNYSLFSSYIHHIDYKVYSEVRPAYRKKIIQFIEYSNRCNQLLFQSKICSDVVNHIINPMVNPMIEDITERYRYIGNRILQQVDKKVSNFFLCINDREESECKDLFLFLLDCIREVDNEFNDKNIKEKYVVLRRKIKTVIIKHISQVFLSPVGDMYLKNNIEILNVIKRKVEQFKKDSDDKELHELIGKFEERYN